MNNIFYTYELCSSITPWLPFYIGKGKEKRMYRHQYDALKGKCKNKHLQNKILKILKEGNTICYHKFNDNVSEEDAFKCEEIAIATFRSAGIKLCNMTDGGEGGIPNEKIRNKMIKNHANRNGKNNGMFGKIPWNKNKHLSKAHSENLSKSLKGKVPWNKNKRGIYSEETLNKIRTWRKTQIITENHKRNNSISQKLRWKNMSIEKRKQIGEKISKTNTGKPGKNKGKILGPQLKETKEKISNSLKLYWKNKKENK